jgi:hypothetical protein
MKEIKLTQIRLLSVLVDAFTISVAFVHSDSDTYDYESYKCKDEADFRRVVSSLNNAPLSPHQGGDIEEYDKWELETFGREGFIPLDIVFESKCTYDGFEAFYYNEDGIMFKAEIIA